MPENSHQEHVPADPDPGDPDPQEPDLEEPEPPKSGPKFLTAMACYAAIAVLAWFTLDGKIRLVVWIFMAGLAARTYLHTLRKP